MAKGYCEVGTLRKLDVVQDPCPRGLGRLVKGKWETGVLFKHSTAVFPATLLVGKFKGP